MKKIFLSQKMRDLTTEEILKRRQMIIDFMHESLPFDFEVIESWHPDFDKNSVYQLGRSLKEMADADMVLLSEESIDNISNFIDTLNVQNIKGSELEALTCLTYKIPYGIYSFGKDPGNDTIKDIKWIMDYR